MPSTGKHLQLCFVNDLVLSSPCRHVVWMQFFIPISTPVRSPRITLIEVKWEGACFSKEWTWSRRSETTVLDKWGPTGPRPVITRSMNGEINAFMTESTGILKILPHIKKWMVPYAPITTEWRKSSQLISGLAIIIKRTMSTIFSVPLYIITQCLSVMAHWSLCWTTSNSCFNQFLTVMFQIKGHTDNLFIWTNHLTKKKIKYIYRACRNMQSKSISFP